jgi:diguanylate cyclase (GGDEF)-like protein
MINHPADKVEQILELAEKWQLAEALAIANETHEGQVIEDGKDLDACQVLIHGALLMRDGKHAEGIRGVLPAIIQLEQHGFKHLLDWAYSTIGFSLGNLGNPKAGLDWVGQAIVGAEKRADESQLRRSLSDKANLLILLNENEKAIAAYEKALSLRNPAPTINEELEILNELAFNYLHLARRIEQDSSQHVELVQKAVGRARSALELLNTSSNNELITRSLENLGSALSRLDKFSEAEAAFEKGLPLSEPYAGIHVELLTSYAGLLCQTQQYDKADSLLIRAYEKAQAENLEASMDGIFETRMRLELLLGINDDALRWAERRFRFMESQHQKRLASIVSNAKLFVEFEQAQERQDETTESNKSLEDPSHMWQDEDLRDELTGCPNKRGLATLSEPFFTPESRTALAMVDIDAFKAIKERFGNEAGDKVIQKVAKILVDSLRDTDLVVRVGGDEFLLLLYGIAGEAAWGTCERLRSAVEHYGWGTIAQGLRVTASIGVAVRKENDGLDPTTFKADEAKQKAKASGRNKVITGA